MVEGGVSLLGGLIQAAVGSAGGLGANVLEARRMGAEGDIERVGALGAYGCCGTVMDGGRSHQADAAVTVLVVVPVEELLAVGSSILERTAAMAL